MTAITPEIVAQHGLSPDEYARAEKIMGREPNLTELGIFSVMWSEHCSYKSSRKWLKTLPTTGPRVICGPGENAGVVDIGDGDAVIFKMESHNHPSFIEPFQGAATGVGGILRDVFTMGARPIATLNALRFGSPDHPKTRHLVAGVVAGIGFYGNCVGVPTVGGECNFHRSYDGNILVNAMTVGIARADKIFYSAAAGPGNPVIAQLSGGMDSTSIVCMSDHLRRCIDPQAKILDTISFFDDSEASLDERRHFLITEQHRGKAGTHLEIVSSQRTFDPPSELGTYHYPGCDDFSLKLERALFTLIWEKGYRSILSGIGGDEVLGGVPNGLPELADYLVSGRLGTLLQRAIAWSLPERTALIGTLYDTARYTTRLYAQNNPKRRPLPAWLSRCMRDSFLELERTMEVVPNRIGVAPHRLENAVTWWHIMETLPHVSPQTFFRPEYRYPMLDKNLVEYLFSIPPDQLVQPGRRRAMMRRALRGIVPAEILERRRKAFQLHASLSAIRTAHDKLVKMMSTSLTAEMGFIEIDAFCSALKATINGDSQWYQAILRTIAYELWLQTRATGSTVRSPQTVPSSLAVQQRSPGSA